MSCPDYIPDFLSSLHSHQTVDVNDTSTQYRGWVSCRRDEDGVQTLSEVEDGVQTLAEVEDVKSVFRRFKPLVIDGLGS